MHYSIEISEIIALLVENVISVYSTSKLFARPDSFVSNHS
jgi:hypothetical protein